LTYINPYRERTWLVFGGVRGGEAGADAAIVAELKEGKEHPASKASDDLKKIVKWVSWQGEPVPLTQKAGASRLF
jgi:hypothetical protein